MKRNESGESLALVSNIQKYTIHDGPGIRTEIFFKGCSLHCLWCSNPEAIRPERQLGVYPARCVGCGSCVKACPLSGAPIVFGETGLARVARGQCPPDCFRCADACPGHAIMVWGTWYTVAELMRIIEEDRRFYLRSGGGVTLSGGEVLLQWEFAAELLTACRQAGIHSCLESALCVPRAHVEAVLPLADMLVCDIKDMDSARHAADCGAGNELILDNIRWAAGTGIPMVIRTPVIPGHNDSFESIAAIGRFIRDELGGAVMQHQLLPYRKMGTEKLASLGQSYPMGDDFEPPPREVWEKKLLQLAEMLREDWGVNAFPGSSQGMN